MSSPRSIKRYTDKWLEMFDEFQADPSNKYVVECSNAKRAKGLRLEFYKAREALANHDPEWFAKEYYNIDRKEVTVVGNKVIFGYKEDSWVAKALEKSLRDGPQPKTAEELEEEARRKRDAGDGAGEGVPA